MVLRAACVCPAQEWDGSLGPEEEKGCPHAIRCASPLSCVHCDVRKMTIVCSYLVQSSIASASSSMPVSPLLVCHPRSCRASRRVPRFAPSFQPWLHCCLLTYKVGRYGAGLVVGAGENSRFNGTRIHH